MAETVAVIDYGSGNLRSAAKALARAAADAAIAAEVLVTADPDAIRRADRVVLPGVGAFADCMAGLNAVAGLKEAMTEVVIAGGKPFLGICVGMQLMAEWGVEFGRHPGLGWLKGEITRLAPSDPALKIPHMGWNTLRLTQDHPVTDGMDGSFVYFLHSFALSGADTQQVFASADYGGVFPAVAGRDNLIGAQFHPEKSQAVGLGLLARFLNWRP